MDHEIGLFGPSAEDHSAEDRGRIMFENGMDHRAKKNIALGSPSKMQQKNKEIIECKLQEKQKTRGVAKRTNWRSRKVFGRRWSTVICLESPKAAKDKALISREVKTGDEYDIENKSGRRVSLTAPAHHGHALRALEIKGLGPRLPKELQEDIKRGVELHPIHQMHALPPRLKCTGVVMCKKAKFTPPKHQQTPPKSPISRKQESDLAHYRRVSAELNTREHRMMDLESRLAPVAFFGPKMPHNLQQQIQNFDLSSLKSMRNRKHLRIETELQHHKRVSAKLRYHENRMMSLESRLAPAAFFARKLPREIQAQIQHFNTATLRRTRSYALRAEQTKSESELEHSQRAAAMLLQKEHQRMALESRLAPTAFFLPRLPHALQREIHNFPKALLFPTGNMAVRPRLPLNLQREICTSALILQTVHGLGSPKVAKTSAVVLRHTGVVSPRPRMRDALLFDIRRHLIGMLRPAGNLALSPKLPADLQAEIKEGPAWRRARALEVHPWLPYPLQDEIKRGVALRHVRGRGQRKRSRAGSEGDGLEAHVKWVQEMRQRVHHDLKIEGKLYQETHGTCPGALTIHLRDNCGYCPSAEECMCACSPSDRM